VKKKSHESTARVVWREGQSSQNWRRRRRQLVSFLLFWWPGFFFFNNKKLNIYICIHNLFA
jgi:hypothetical protein